MQILKSDTADPRFLELERQLDKELWDEFSDEMIYYAPHNKFRQPIKAIVLLQDQAPIACGAFKELENRIEIKRMFVHPEFRGMGMGRKILSALESWALNLGYEVAVLETGNSLLPAIQLYKSSGYRSFPCYGPYQDRPRSRCFQKILSKKE